MPKKTNKVMTYEEFENFKKSISSFERRGCVSTRPCYNCKTVYEDSPCFCVGNFTCEVCGYENGIPIKPLEQISNKVFLNIKEHKRPEWDEYFLKVAETISLRSEDRFIRHGAVLVDRFNRIRGTGYNGLIPNGTYTMEHPAFTGSTLVDLNDRNARRKWMLHAEKNTILNSDCNPRIIGPCTMYITARPCFNCVQDMITYGIKRIVYYDVTGTITEDKDDEDIKKLIKVSNTEVEAVKLN